MMFTVLTLLSMNAEAQEEAIEAPTLTFEELGWVPRFKSRPLLMMPTRRL